MKQYYFLAIFALFIASCGEKTAEPKERVNYSEKIVANFTQWDAPGFKKPDVTLSKTVQSAVSQLANDTLVPTERYQSAFKTLKSKATENELLLLTVHENPVIRCHAYTALNERQYRQIHRVCFEHFNDTLQKVTLTIDGRKFPLSVRTWMLYGLRPESGSEYSFKNKLYRRYLSDYPDLKREKRRR
jgi:hypothetical protein